MRTRRLRASVKTVGSVTAALALTAGMALVGGGAAHAGDGTCTVNGSWPQYLADPTHNANSCSAITTSNVNHLRPAWYYGTAGTVTATPAVVGGVVYDGDSTGILYAINQSTGHLVWSENTLAPQTCFLDQPNGRDEHNPTAGNGEIAGSPTVATINGVETVFVDVGGSIMAFAAADGSCLWAQDVDPASPTNTIEVESSPVVDTATTPPEVVMGSDENSNNNVGVTGIQAFNAATGALLWRYEPERDATLLPSQFGGSDFYTLSCGDGTANPDCTPANVANMAPNDLSYGDGCGDVWSSPALDTSFVDPAGDNTYQGWQSTAPAAWTPAQVTASGAASADGLVVFGTGNCAAANTPATAQAHGDYVDNETVFAVDPITGVRAWDYVEPYNIYDNNANEPGGGDDDFGSSAVLVTIPTSSVPAGTCPSSSATTTLVVEGSKSGYAYGLCEGTGGDVWKVQASQPGQLSPDTVGSIGGFLGGPAVGLANGKPTVFFTSAIPLPFANDGVREPGDGDINISTCPGLSQLMVLLPACPDLTLPGNWKRLASTHAVDAATGAIDWQGQGLPTYGAASYTDGVLFAPQTVGFGVQAFNADTGQTKWFFPLGASASSEVAIVGGDIVLGAGTQQAVEFGLILPPQINGIWDFSINAPLLPTITFPPVPSADLTSPPSLP